MDRNERAAYGGSTIVCVFPRGSVEWDEDLVRNSEGGNVDGVQIETMVKVRATLTPLGDRSLSQMDEEADGA